MFGNEGGDWTEDFSHENGNYWNTCCVCEKTFTGHKRRVVCKNCSKHQSIETAMKKLKEELHG